MVVSSTLLNRKLIEWVVLSTQELGICEVLSRSLLCEGVVSLACALFAEVACLERGEVAGSGGLVLVFPPFSATAAVLLREAVGKSAEKLSVPILFRGVVGGELEVVMAASRMLEAGAVLLVM